VDVVILGENVWNLIKTEIILVYQSHVFGQFHRPTAAATSSEYYYYYYLPTPLY